MRERVTDTLAGFVPSERTHLGYLFWLSRPRFWLYLAGPVIVGVVYAATEPTGFFDPVAVALFVYFLLPANVFLYGVNDIFDADVDEHNPKKAAEGREVQYGGDSTVVLAVAVSALLALSFVPFLPVEALIALVGFLLLGGTYSAPPLRFKTTPLLDSLSNGLYILPAVAAYAALAGTFPPTLAIAGGWVWAMGMHTFSAIPDIEPDREAGIETTATALGEVRTLVYCAGCWVAAAVLFGLLHLLLGATLAIYPLFVGATVFGDVDISRAYWWFPVLNTLVGTVVTLGGIWVVLHG